MHVAKHTRSAMHPATKGRRHRPMHPPRTLRSCSAPPPPATSPAAGQSLPTRSLRLRPAHGCLLRRKNVKEHRRVPRQVSQGDSPLTLDACADATRPSAMVWKRPSSSHSMCATYRALSSPPLAIMYCTAPLAPACRTGSGLNAAPQAVVAFSDNQVPGNKAASMQLTPDWCAISSNAGSAWRQRPKLVSFICSAHQALRCRNTHFAIRVVGACKYSAGPPQHQAASRVSTGNRFSPVCTCKLSHYRGR